MFWQSDSDPSIVRVTAQSDVHKSGGVTIDFSELNAHIRVLRAGADREYVRITSGFNSIAFEVVEGSVLQKDVVVHYHIDDMRNVPAQLQTIDRFYALWRQGSFRKSNFPLDTRRQRWLLALRALDMDIAGLSHRRIADTLFSGAQDISWKEPGGRTRSRVRRIIALGRELSDGGYRQILAGRFSNTSSRSDNDH